MATKREKRARLDTWLVFNQPLVPAVIGHILAGLSEDQLDAAMRYCASIQHLEPDVEFRVVREEP